MWKDLLLQAAMLGITIFMFLWMHNLPQKLYSYTKLRLLSRTGNLQSKRHFVHGAQLLSQARSASNSSNQQQRSALLDQSISAAEKSISLDPKDAAAHILKALALELQGFSAAALDSLDAALSPLCRRSLSGLERSDALCKRAELKLGAGRVDSAVEDLVESIRVGGDESSTSNKGKAFGLLGKCYEKKGMRKEAQKAYEDGLRVQPDCYLAQQGLDRLTSSST